MAVETKQARSGERIRKPDALIGKVLLGDYPAHNYRGIRLRYEPRRVLVESVRLMREKPVEDATREAEPTLRRFGILVGGRDLDKGETRHFYLGAFESWRLVEPTPEVLFPRLCWKYDEQAHVFDTSDPRESISRAALNNRNPCVIHPVSSATCFPSRTCLAE